MFPAKQDSDKSRVPFVSFTGRDHALAAVFLPAQEFGKRSDVFRILMPAAFPIPYFAATYPKFGAFDLKAVHSNKSYPPRY